MSDTQKSGAQKFLKVMSILAIIGAVLAIIAGFLIGMGSGMLAGETITVDGQSYDEQGTAIIIAVMLFGSGLIDLLVGCLGLRGANDPSKIGPYFVICIIALVWQILDVGLTAYAGQALTSPIVALIFAVIYLLVANSIRNQAKN